ncbi:MAG: lipoyl(octanoyl) transferase LipB [Deltaproteobacteria bacterium]|nr:lipoyl(octanoyl) transferase LipB [Deltaproteobacteria bacterium]
MKKLDVINLGMVSYGEGLELMMHRRALLLDGRAPDTLLVLSHEPVITKGRQLKNTLVTFDPMIKKMGIQVRDADRGGLLTYHGPGQIVIYFIIRVKEYFKGVREMVEAIEAVLVVFLRAFKLDPYLKKEHPGVWVGKKKLASLGLRVSQGVTTHGVSLNVNNDLGVYRYFEPCGLSGETQTNLKEALNNSSMILDCDDIAARLVDCFVKRLTQA